MSVTRSRTEKTTAELLVRLETYRARWTRLNERFEDMASGRPTRPADPPMSRVDVYLLLTAIIWGSNYSVIKFVVQDVPGRAFNGLRLAIASAVFLSVIAARRMDHVRRLSRRDWAVVVLLGIVGQFMYQILFIDGLERTSAMNASIIIACTPIAVSVVSAALGHERLPLAHWLGTALSFVGVTLIVGGGAVSGVSSPVGDIIFTNGSVITGDMVSPARMATPERSWPWAATAMSLPGRRRASRR